MEDETQLAGESAPEAQSDAVDALETVQAAQETETKEEEAAEPAEERPPTLDDLLAAAKEDALLNSEDTHKGVDFNKTLQSLPDDAKKLMSNLRKDYTQKMQSLSQERTNFEAQRKALIESDAYKTLQQAAEKETGEFDPYDPDSFVERIKQEVAKSMADALKPMQEEYALQQNQAKLDSFMDKHTELRTDDAFRAEVRTVLEKNESLDLESAYWMVKGKHLSTEKASMAEELGIYKTALKDAGMKVGGRSRDSSGMRPPAGMTDAYEIYKYLEKHQKR